MGSYDSINVRKTTLFTDGTLIVSGNNVQSPWLNVGGKQTVNITKKHTTGTYTMTLEWSRDGVTADFTTTLALTDNVATAVTVSAPFLRITIAATVANFTVHRTVVYG